MSNLPLARIGEHGFDLVVRTSYDASGHSGLTLEFAKPDGTETSVTSGVSFSWDGTDGDFSWTATEDFFDQVGTWYLDVVVDMGATGERKLRKILAFTIGSAL